MSRALSPEQQRLILQAGLESLVADALMGYTHYLGGGSDSHLFNGTGVWIDVTKTHHWRADGLPFIAWKAIRTHGEGYPAEQIELRRHRAELVRLQSSIPPWPWGAPPEELAAHKQALSDNHTEQDHLHALTKQLVRRMLAAGGPDQPIDLLEAAGLPYETVTPPRKRRQPTEPTGIPRSGPGQEVLF